MKKQASGIGLYLIIIGVILVGYYFFVDRVSQENQFTYQELETALEAEEIAQIDILPNRSSDSGQIVVKLKNETEKQFYVTNVNEIEVLTRGYNVKLVVHDEPEDNTFLATLMPMLIVVLLMFFFFTMLTRQMNGGSNSIMLNFGKSRAHLSTEEDKHITFKNVAGLDEEKEDLVEIVDFLKNPGK